MVHFNVSLLLHRHKNLDDSRLCKQQSRVSYKKIIPKLHYKKLTSCRLNYTSLLENCIELCKNQLEKSKFDGFILNRKGKQKGQSKITGSGRDKTLPELSLGPLYSQTRVQKFSHSAECYCWNTDFGQEIAGIPRFADRRQACFLAE